MARKTFEIEEIKVIKHKIPVTEHKLPETLRKFTCTRDGSRGSYLDWRADMSGKEREEAAQTIINDMADNVIVNYPRPKGRELVRLPLFPQGD